MLNILAGSLLAANANIIGRLQSLVWRDREEGAFAPMSALDPIQSLGALMATLEIVPYKVGCAAEGTSKIRIAMPYEEWRSKLEHSPLRLSRTSVMSVWTNSG